MIVITAPTSNIGTQVLANILDSERDEVIEGSHSKADVVSRAFEGADSVFWLVPADPRVESADAAYVEFARPGCEAFKNRGVKRVVGISALGRGWSKDAGHVTASLKADDMIAGTDVSYRALTCASLMENVLRQAALIKDKGAFYWPTPGDLKEPACATRDVAARLLLNPLWTGVDSIPMLGPGDLSFNDMMLKRGASEGMGQAMVNMMTTKNDGMDHLVQRTSSSLTDTPTSFREWCEKVLKPAVFNRTKPIGRPD